MECKICGHRQSEGKFCGSCGAEMEAQPVTSNLDGAQDEVAVSKEVSDMNEIPALEVETETVEATTPEEKLDTVQPATEGAETSTKESTATDNEFVEKVKEISSAYWAYFMNVLQKPNHVKTQDTDGFINGIINIVIAALFFTIALYSFLAGIFGEFLPAAKTLFSSFLYVTVAIGVAYLLIIAATKVFSSKNLSFKETISVYGLYMTPVILLNLVALLFALLKITNIALYLILLGFFIMILFIPLYLVSYYLTNNSQTLEPFYGYLIYIVGFLLALAILNSLLLDNIMPSLPFGNPFMGW